MSSIGIRVAISGVDVKTGADKDMALTSKYSIFKGTISGTGSTTINRNGTPTVITIPHNLGYAPMVQAFYEDLSEVTNSPGYYFPLPASDYYGSGYTSYEWSYTVRADNTNIYLKFVFQDLL